MQFFDYDADLSLFNSLMEETEAPANPEAGEQGQNTEAGEPVQGDDTAKTPKKRGSKKSTDKSKFTGSTIVKAISDALINKDLNYKLFYETYYPKEPDSKPFVLCKVGGFTIKNDPHLGTYVEKTDDTHITVNLSAAINAKSRAKVAKDLEHMQDKRTYADREDSLYQLAKIQVLDSFATLINHVLKDPDYEKNKILEPEEKKALQKKAKEEKEAKKAQAEQNPQEEQQPQEQQNPQEEQQPQEQQNPQEDQQPQEQQNPQNDPDTPSDEDDPNALYKKIRKNFQENYKEDMMIDCKNQAGSLDDDGKDALVDKYYDMAMEDFPDVYDDDVQQRVQDLIASYVDLYTKTNDSQQNQQNKNPDDPDEDEFNFDPNKKKKNPNGQDDGDNDQFNNNDGSAPGNSNGKHGYGYFNSNGKHGYGYFNWLNNTLKHWDQSGVTNTAANPKPGVEHADYTVKQAKKDWLAGRRERKGIKSTNTHKKTDNQNVDKIIDED